MWRRFRRWFWRWVFNLARSIENEAYFRRID